MLACEQVVQPVVARGVVGRAVEQRHLPLKVTEERGLVAHQGAPLDEQLLQPIRLLPLQRFQQLDQGREGRRVAKLLPKVDGRQPDERGEGAWGDRQRLAVVAQDGFALVNRQLQLPRFEGHAERLSEDGDDDLARRHLGLAGPVDIEVAGVAGAGAVAEDIPPPWVLPPDADMVGDDIEDEPHIVVAQQPGEVVKRGQAPELGIDLAVVEDIVAVGAARRGREDR